MKFGLYGHNRTTGIVLRRIDETAVTLPVSVYTDTTTPSSRWDAIISAGGKTANYDPNDPSWVLLYGSRAEANFLYGVPADVELYGIDA